MTRRQGSVEVICGPTLAGKTVELIRRIKHAEIARQKVQVFKHSLDMQGSVVNVVSYEGASHRARAVDSVSALKAAIRPDTQVVAIDGAHFFGSGLANLVENLANQGRRVIVAGLDLDFRGEPFEEMTRIAAQAEEVTKLLAICVFCETPTPTASRTQRLINGRPAPYNDKRIRLTGNGVSHKPCCRRCHQVPRK